MSVDVGQSAVGAVVEERESFVIDAQKVKDRGVEVVHVVRFRRPSRTTRRSRRRPIAALDAGAGQPLHGGAAVVVAAVGPLAERVPAELRGPEDQRVVEQPALLEVGQQGGDGPVGRARRWPGSSSGCWRGCPSSSTARRRRSRPARSARRARQAGGRSGSCRPKGSVSGSSRPYRSRTPRSPRDRSVPPARRAACGRPARRKRCGHPAGVSPGVRSACSRLISLEQRPAVGLARAGDVLRRFRREQVGDRRRRVGLDHRALVLDRQEAGRRSCPGRCTAGPRGSGRTTNVGRLSVRRPRP